MTMVSSILVEGHPLIQSFPIKFVDQPSNYNIFSCLPREILENIASTYHACHHNRFSRTGILILLHFISVEMALEQTIKDLQAQKRSIPTSAHGLGQGPGRSENTLHQREQEEEKVCHPQRKKKVQGSCPTSLKIRCFF